MHLRVGLFTLLVPLSLFAAGHDVSAVRYVPASIFPTGGSAVAFNGNRFLTIWAMGSHVYGSLTDPASGNTTVSFPVRPFAQTVRLKMVSADSGFIAVWTEGDHTALANLTAEGVVQRVVALQQTTLSAPKMAWNGRHLLILDQTSTINDETPTINASLYGLDGRLLARTALPVFGRDSYDVTESDGEFAVATAGYSGVHALRIGDDGNIASDLLLQYAPAVPPSLESVAVASSNHVTAVAWTIIGSPLGYAASISAAGNIAAPIALPLSGKSAFPGIALVRTGSGYTVVWNTDSGAITAARLDASAHPLDAQPVILSNGFFSSAASSGDILDIVMGNQSSSAVMTLTAASGPNGIVPGSPVTASVTAVRQLSPVVASDGLDFLAVWREWPGMHLTTLAGRFNRSGDPLDGTGITLPGDFDVFGAAAARGPGSQTLIVQTTTRGVLATRWSGAAGPLDSNPIVIAGSVDSSNPAVVWNGSRYFAVWAAGTQLLGAFIGSDGAVTAPISLPYAAADFRGGPSSPDLAWDGRQFLVTIPVIANLYCSQTCSFIPPDEVRVIRVSAEGNVLDHPAITIPGFHRGARVATSGNEFLVVLNSGTSVSSMVVHTIASGVQLGVEETIFPWFADTTGAVAWDGSAYIVSWRYSGGDGAWLAAARAGHSGQVSQTTVTSTFRSDPSGGQWSAPSIAVNDAGDTVIAIDEAAPPSYLSRARAYFSSELSTMPPVPAAPRNIVSHFGGHTALIEWQSDGASGFLLEESVDFGNRWFSAGTLSGDLRSTSVAASIGNQFRIRAFGPGGLSSGTITSIGTPLRLRAVRR